MAISKRFLWVCLISLALVMSFSANVIAQSVDTQPQKIEVAEAGDSFHREVIKAAIELNRKGELKRRDLIKLRVAMISPAFREQAMDLAIIQMNASGSESAPGTEVDPVAIDWEGFAAFLEKLVPLIITLINAFAAAG